MAEQPLNEKDQEDLTAYLDGELADREARALEARLQLDRGARREADALKKTWDLLDYLPRPEPSPSFTHRTMERLTAQQKTTAQQSHGLRRWLKAAAWAAAVLAAFAGGFLAASHYFRTQQAALEEQLVGDLPLIENLRAFEFVDDLDFLNKLANPNDPDLFGEQSPRP